MLDPRLRHVILARDPLATARQALAGHETITPNERAETALTPAGFHLSLQEAAARRLVNSAGLARAAPETQFAALRRAVSELGMSDDPRGAARAYAPAVRELLRAGAGFSGVSASELPPRGRRLLELVLRYRGLLDERASVDPAETLWRACRAGGARAKVLVHGYVHLGVDELSFLDDYATAGSVVVLPEGFAASEEAAARLADLGWLPGSDGATWRLGVELAARLRVAFGTAPAESLAQVTTLPAGASGWRAVDQDHEVRFVLGRVKTLLATGVAPSDVVLVARDEQLYGPLLAAVASEYRLPLKLSYSVPLKRSRLGAFLSQLAEVVSDGLPYEATARLLAHRFVRLLDAQRWQAARQQRPQGLREWSALVPEAAALAWPHRAEPAGHLAHLNQALAALGAATRIATSVPDAAALERVTSALAASGVGEQSRGAFFAEFDDVLDLSGASVDTPWARGVELHSPLAVLGAAYRHVFVLGAAEGVLPAGVGDDPMLDAFERAAFAGAGLPLEEAVAAAERESLTFVPSLLAAGETLTLSYPEVLAGREQLPSPYFAALGIEARPARERGTASELELLTLTLPQASPELPARRAFAVELRREGALGPDEFDGVLGVQMTPGDGGVTPAVAARVLSASQLMSLGQCPFRWFAQRLLRLAEPREKEEAASPATLGSLFHAALRRAVEAAQAEIGADARGERLRVALKAHLPSAFAAAEADEGTPDNPSWPRERSEHLQTLQRAVDAPDFIAADAAIVGVEAEFSAVWRGFRVTGVVDRIDALMTSEGGSEADEALMLTDYKLGKSAPLGAIGSDGKPTLDLQLPLYVEAAASRLRPEAEAEVAGARYFSINGAATLREARRDKTELAAFAERVRANLEQGSFPVAPDAEQKVCAYCEYDLVCRRGPRLGRKRAAP